MDLLGSSAANTGARQPSAQSPSGTDEPASTRTAVRSSPSTAVRSPSRIATVPSRLPPTSTSADRKMAAQRPLSSSTPTESTPSPQSRLTSAATSQSSLQSQPPLALPSSSVSCRAGTDCSRNICFAGICQKSSGFATSLYTAPTTSAVTSTVHTGANHKGKHGAHPTACSDPRCTLPADITSMNGAEDASSTLGSDQRAMSSAATAGIVLAVLFAILALLLIVPKVRDWLYKCFGYDKDDDGSDDIIYTNHQGDNGSPEFGNSHASAFLQEKRRTMARYSYGEKAGQNQNYVENEDYLPGYENNGQGDIADIKVDMKQDDYFNDYNGYYNQHNTHTTYEAPPVLPALYHDTGHSTRDLASYVEHHPVTRANSQRRPYAPALSTAPAPTSVTFVNARSEPADLTPWNTNGRDAQVRETVLPYTVEEDRDALLGLKNLGTPAQNDITSGGQSQFKNSRDAYTTPKMQNRGFDNNTLASPATPITPGSAYSVNTALLPASLRPGQGQGVSNGTGRAPILKQGLSATRPAFKRFSAALRFDSNTKRS